VDAVLAGARSYAAIADWAAHADHAVTLCGPTPHATTFGRVLGAVDADPLKQVLTGWVLTRRARLPGQRAGDREPAAAARQVPAVDGKTLRGARDQTGAGAGPSPAPSSRAAPAARRRPPAEDRVPPTGLGRPVVNAGRGPARAAGPAQYRCVRSVTGGGCATALPPARRPAGHGRHRHGPPAAAPGGPGRARRTSGRPSSAGWR
jgi:hypothetical protein